MGSPSRRPPSGALSPRGCFNYTPLSTRQTTLYGGDRTVRLFRDDRLVGLGVSPYPTAGLLHPRREFPCDWELPMTKPNTRRAVARAACIATGTGGICLLLSLSATQAYAATGDQPSALSGLTSTVSGVLQAVTDPVTGALGSVVNSVTEPATSTTGSTTSTAPATSQASTPSNNQGSQPAPTASATPSDQPTAPSGGQTAPKPTATNPATSPTGRATPTTSAAPTVSRNPQSPAPIRSVAAPTASAAVRAPGATSGVSAPRASKANPETTRSAEAPVAATTEPTQAASPTPQQTHHRPTADIASPLSGLPGWLVDVLLATGLLAASAFATEPVIVLARRRRQRGHESAK